MKEALLAVLKPPEEIRRSLSELEKNTVIDKVAQKGANGYLVFGENSILKRRVAIKYYYWGSDPAYHAEPSFLAGVKSPHIIEVLDAGLAGREWAYFVTPYCRNGDLDDLLEKGLPGNRSAISLTTDILDGLGQLHSKRLVHRDLKPQNILLSDGGAALIGDFGSVKRLPDGNTGVPGSGHSIAYRPPEAIGTKCYQAAGDIYQCGMVLFQLLGGRLPYEPTAWLNRRERRDYDLIADPVDRNVYVDAVLSKLIVSGRLIDLSTMPCWVPSPLRRVVGKACDVDPSRRFQSAADFMAGLHGLRSTTPDWGFHDDLLTLRGETSYRLVPASGELFTIEKRGTGDWRRVRTVPAAARESQVKVITKMSS